MKNKLGIVFILLAVVSSFGLGMMSKEYAQPKIVIHETLYIKEWDPRTHKIVRQWEVGDIMKEFGGVKFWLDNGHWMHISYEDR